MGPNPTLRSAATPAARSPKGEGDPIPVGILSPLPVAQLSDKSRVNSSSYRNEALASHGGSQVLNVAPQTERNPGHSGAMADASKAADAVDATGSLSVGALAVPDSGRLEACSICEAFSPIVTAAIADHCEDNGASELETASSQSFWIGWSTLLCASLLFPAISGGRSSRG